MRPRLVLLTVLIALAATPATASAAQSVTCAAPSATVLFWPRGHAVVKGVGFPKIPTPHIEVYVPGAGYATGNFLLYADAKRFVDPSRTCGAGTVAKTNAVRNAKTIRQTKAITCTATAALAYDVKNARRGLTIIGHAGAEAVFRLEVRPKRSTFTYDRKACRAAPRPR